MNMMASQNTSFAIVYPTFVQAQIKKTQKLRVTGLCGGSPPVTVGFPSQRASNAENVSIWWRHHEYQYHKTTLGKRNAFLVIVSPKKLSKRFLGEPKWRFLGDCFWESSASSYFRRYKWRHLRGDWKKHCLHWVATDVVNARVCTFDCTFSFERYTGDPREMCLHVTAACIAKWPIGVYMVCHFFLILVYGYSQWHV